MIKEALGVSSASGLSMDGTYYDGNREHSKPEMVILQANINLGKSNQLAGSGPKTSGKDQHVQVDLWYASLYEIEDSSLDLPALALMHEIFRGNVTFRPRAVFSKCTYCSGKWKRKNCILSGQICPTKPLGLSSNQLQQPTVGPNVPEEQIPQLMVEETIRELCVYEAIEEESKSHWFYYVNHLLKQCSVDPNDLSHTMLISELCHDSVVESLASNKSDGIKINLESYNDCVKH